MKSSPLLPAVQKRKQLKYGKAESVLVFLITKGHCSATSPPFFGENCRRLCQGKKSIIQETRNTAKH